MKKTSKMFGAVALSAALAFGCALPAFAETRETGDGFDSEVVTADGTEITQDNKGDAKTDINLRTETDQINCTLPVKMTVVAKLDGGKILCPTNTAYKIVNKNEDSPLYVTKVAATIADKWGADSSTTDFTSENVLAGTPTTGNYGNFCMNLTPAEGDAIVLAGANAVGDVATAAELATPWKIAKAPDADGTSFGLTLAGRATAITGIDTDKVAGEKLLTVTYTVSAMAKTAATQLAPDATPEP